jgi:3,4-dihydroxy 2-butanone 4-phosphate synthase/GTP cyclohydrolase II
MSVLVEIEEAIEEIRHGRMVILVDDEDRENEGDLTMAAEKVTPEAINFMTKYGRGLLCLSMTSEKIQSLELPMMVNNNKSPFGTGFTVSIEAAKGVTTGISAHDRAVTIITAVDKDASPKDLISPEGSGRRCFGTGRSNRRECGSGPTCRLHPCRGDLRSDER